MVDIWIVGTVGELNSPKTGQDPQKREEYNDTSVLLVELHGANANPLLRKNDE